MIPSDGKDFFYQLTPEHILGATESLGGQATGRMMALNSYENRVYEVWLEGGARRVIKFYRPGRWSKEAILEEHSFLAELKGSEVPVVSPLEIKAGQTLGEREGLYFAVFPKAPGQIVMELDADQISWLGRLLGRLHAVGSTSKFQHRLKVDVQDYGQRSLDLLLQSNLIPESIEHNFEHRVSEILKDMLQRQVSRNLRTQRIHADLHHSNLLWNQDGPFFLDFDDAATGPVAQDFWLLWGGPLPTGLYQEVFVRNYELFSDFPWDQMEAVRDLRRLRQLRYAGWIAERWDDPIFPKTFPHFGSAQYFGQLLQDLLEEDEHEQDQSKFQSDD